MDRRRLLEALEWALPPVQLDELLEILLAVECLRRVPSVGGMKSDQKQQQQQQKKVTPVLSTSFDDFFASADRDRRLLPPLSRSISNEEEEEEGDVEMINAGVQQQQKQQPKKTTEGKQAVQQEGEGETCYEAAVDAFSRLTIFYEALREELPPTTVLTT